MKIQFKEWNPNAATRERLDQVQTVLTQFSGMGIRITLRQLYYQLVSKNIIRNKQREYKNLGNMLSDARLAGLVDWNAIEDRARHPVVPPEWTSIGSIVDACVRSFRLPRWDTQPGYLELWCEKDALSSVLAPIADQYHVTLMVNRGYSSQSAMFEARNRILRAIQRKGVKPTIIYLGDLDPSGEDMVRDVKDRLAMMLLNVNVVKLALNPEQVEQYSLPPNPAKMTDSRAEAFVDKHGSDSYEVDAIPPDELIRIVTEAITSRMDMKAYEAVRAREGRLSDKLQDVAGNIEED